MAIYMKADNIEGHVTTKGYEQWIELISFEYGVYRNISTKPGNVIDREATKPTLSEVAIQKKMDKTSPKLFEQACVGRALDKVEIHFCQTGVDRINPYMQYTLYDVIVSEYQTSAEDGCQQAAPKEDIRLNFDRIEMRYTPYDAKHNPSSPIPAGYDLSAGTKI